MDIQEAIAAVKANPPDDASPLPWKAQPRRHEVIDAVAAPVADTISNEDAAHIAAAVNAAPILIAEVERLQAMVEAARVAVQEVCNPVHSAGCRRSRRESEYTTECICGALGEAIVKLRRALGLEGA